MSNVEFTTSQKSYIRKKTKVHDLDPSELPGELNIVPFLDIVTNLIIFLLATTASVLAIAEIEAQLPQTSRSARASSSSPASQSTLQLNITTTRQGVIIAASGGKLDQNCNMATGNVITVPRQGGTIAWERVTRCLVRIKSQFPDEDQVIVAADPEIEFEEFVQSMDAARSNGADPLFPELLISAGVR